MLCAFEIGYFHNGDPHSINSKIWEERVSMQQNIVAVTSKNKNAEIMLQWESRFKMLLDKAEVMIKSMGNYLYHLVATKLCSIPLFNVLTCCVKTSKHIFSMPFCLDYFWIKPFYCSSCRMLIKFKNITHILQYCLHFYDLSRSTASIEAWLTHYDMTWLFSTLALTSFYLDGHSSFEQFSSTT